MLFDEVKAGDLIAVSSKGISSNIIQVGTLSIPNIGPLGRWGLAGVSHVAIAAPVFGEIIVYESTVADRPPCVRTGREKPIGVQAHFLSDILSGGGDVWHYPLRRPLYEHEEDRLLFALEGCLGRGYDYLGATKSGGGILFRLLNRLLKGNEDLRTIFCSELVFWAWVITGVAQNRHAGTNPNWLVRYARRIGIVGKGRLLS